MRSCYPPFRKERERMGHPAVLPSDTPDHPLGNSKDVSELLAHSINQLRRGQLDPKVATCIGYLSTVLLRALEQGPAEERLAKIEATLAANAQKLSEVL